MKKEFGQLSEMEKELLLRAPAIVSVLAASKARKIYEWEKADAIQLTQLKTFTARSLVIDYYKEVENVFEQNFETVAKKYAPFDDVKMEKLQNEVDTINHVIDKLETEFADELHASLRDFAEHVKNAYKGLVVNFLFPISGLTE